MTFFFNFDFDFSSHSALGNYCVTPESVVSKLRDLKRPGVSASSQDLQPGQDWGPQEAMLWAAWRAAHSG